MIVKYKKIIFIIFFALSFICFSNINLVSADADELLFGGQEEEIGDVIGLGDTDPRIVIANVIRITLGFLGIIAVMLIMYAGWLYMSASGEEDKIEQAKKILMGAVVGLVIILASFALATFVLNRLYDISGNTGSGGGCDPACLSGFCCVSGLCVPCGFDPNGVSLTSNISPPNGSDYYPMNTIGEVRFNKKVVSGSGTFSDNGENLSYNFVNDSKLEFVNQVTCSDVALGTEIVVPGSWEDRFCFDPAVDYSVSVSGYQSLNGDQTLNCIIGCTSNFKVAAVIDIAPPEIIINQSQAMCANYNIEISARAIDDYGVSEMSFSVSDGGGNEIFQYTSVPSSLTKSFSDSIDLSNIINTAGDYLVIVSAIDVAGNESESQKLFTVWPDHCCNNEFDGDGDSDLVDPNKPETDIDCGGECGACEGGSCAIDMTTACNETEDENCLTNLCSDSLLCNCEDNDGGNCTNAGYFNINGDPYQIADFSKCCICRNWPIINNVSPSGGGICVNIGTGATNNNPCLSDDNCGTGEACDLFTLEDIPNGASGSMVTISGRNFGISPGEVYFCNNLNVGECIGWSLASLAESINDNCINSWTDSMIVAVVPVGATNGPIKIITESGFEELTNDQWGKSINDFVVNNFERPGICMAENDNVSGEICSSDEECSPHECISENRNKTCLKNQGYFEENISYQGIGLLSGTDAYFGDFYSGYEEAYYNSSTFSGQSGSAQVPNIQNKKTSTFVINNNLLSNNLDFYKIEDINSTSKIIYFDPVSGRDGQYVTIHGQGLGSPGISQIGVNYKVFFDDDLSDNEINDENTLGTLASFDFPDICKTNGLWKDDEILIKAPELIDGDYFLVIKIDNKINLIDSSDVDSSIDGYENTFLYNSTYPLRPGLCAMRPRSGQRNTEVNLYGENMGSDLSHRVIFGSEYIDSFSYGSEADAERITISVPEGVADGDNKVSVSQESGIACTVQSDCDDGWNCIGSECQAIGNSLRFQVGDCVEDTECGSGYYCCDDGSFAHSCQSGSDEDDACYKTFSSCVYEFDFTTGSSSPIDDDLDSCLGFGRDESTCNYNYCPNSPGWCSYNDATEGEIANDCSTVYCDGFYSGSTYIDALNKCVDGNQCSLDENITVNRNNQDYQVEKYCDTYNSNNVWHYRLSGGTCEVSESIFGDGITNWTNIGNNICVHLGESCDVCSSGLDCLEDGGVGVCAYDRDVCASGYGCNDIGQCERDKEPCCDCCCDINQNESISNPSSSGNPGCCAPLECGFECGEGERDIDNDGNPDIDFGLCTGCTVYNNGSIDIVASDNACNCSESDISGKYCDTAAADGLGVCRDCASLQDDFEDCSEHNSCCVDNKNSDNCRGINNNDSFVARNYRLANRYDFSDDNNYEGWDITYPGNDSGWSSVERGMLNFGCEDTVACEIKIEKSISLPRYSNEVRGYLFVVKTADNEPRPNVLYIEIGEGANNLGPFNTSFDNNESDFRFEYSDASIDRNNLAYSLRNTEIAIDYIEVYELLGDANYCAYYSCGDNGLGDEVCLVQAPTRDGDYKSDNCNEACGYNNGSRLGSSCYIRVDNLGIDECTYDFCPDFYCLNSDGNEAFDGNGDCTNGGDPSSTNCGICCCDPNATEDNCTAVDESLSCLANVTPCSGNNRGMCCGCSEDSDCSIGDPDNIGCGDDSCCHARPLIEAYLPVNDDIGVCRNTLIQATFNERMDDGSLLGNLIVVGNYGVDQCPENSTYLVYENGEFKEVNFIARTLNKILHFANNIIKPITGKNAFAANNFCAISGSTENIYNTLSDKTSINFNLDNLLDVNRDYYVIIKGDKNLNSSDGVLNFWGIGMVENNETLISSTNGFNGLDFTASKIWRFTTGENICALDLVDVKPDNFVFKLEENDIIVLGKTQDFTAYAITSQGDGGEISSTAEYNWTWNWTIDNPQVIDFQTGSSPDENPQTVVAQNQQDASTFINAEARISTAPVDMVDSVGRSVTGKELVRVFACNNPWPPVVGGEWLPWADSDICTQNLGDCINTNYEIYYCRDSGDFGTADDLPAILSDTITVGHSIGDDVLKESYFFREGIPDDVTLFELPSPAEGGSVSLRWNAIDIPTGETLDVYKVYYGERSGDYTNSVTTTDLSYIISGLDNEKEYYFVVTAVFESTAEGDYSIEVAVTPHDLEGPVPPTINQIISGNSEVSIEWEDASNGDVVAFRAYYVSLDAGDTCGVNTTFGGSVSVPYATGATTVITDLNSGIEYCFGMVGYDDSGNSSSVSVMGPIVPEGDIVTPSNLSATAGDQEIGLNWDFVNNAEQYRIYVGTTMGTYTNEYLTFNNYYNLSGLTNGQQYYLGVSAISFAGTESSLSEITVIPSESM